MSPLQPSPRFDGTLRPARACRLLRERPCRYELLQREGINWPLPARSGGASRRRSGIVRRGFNLVELTIALAISAALLTATMVALDASYKAYQATTEEASTHTISRLAIHRMQALIRTGTEFGPFPVNPNDSIVLSDYIDFITPEGDLMTIGWDSDTQELYITTNEGGTEATYTLLGGVIGREDEDGDPIAPFMLEYERGRNLHRVTIDLTITPDDNMDVQLDGNYAPEIRLVASAQPRTAAFDD